MDEKVAKMALKPPPSHHVLLSSLISSAVVCFLLVLAIIQGLFEKFFRLFRKKTSSASTISDTQISLSASPQQAPKARLPGPDQWANLPYLIRPMHPSSSDFASLVAVHGYECEFHKVVTADGYILTLQRLVNPQSRPSLSEPRPAVLLQHGLMQCSAVFVMNGDQSLGFTLLESGFDVWLGNTRGNIHSQHHTSLSPTTEHFWQYDLDHLGAFDAPAIVSKVLELTQQKKLLYIGHSQGVTSIFAALSTQPDLAEKVSLVVAVAPGVYVQPMTNRFLKYLSTARTQSIFNVLGVGEFFPLTRGIRNMVPGGLYAYFAHSMSDFLFQWKDHNWTAGRKPVFYAHTPAGSSVRNVAHWFQIYQANDFRFFDHGEAENLKRYQSVSPPAYPLENITTPVALFYGAVDRLVDSERLIPVLKKSLVFFFFIFY
eukprot:TRINITY_DN3611_c0_g1_i1.p1 TRINITY_DN3611_c0_g1~~TRINITY_DN3611_c0_g1_i1.p1  ORF type:complete len:439 (-),score=98.07 TRINITY_DN3611_c0_g1_i1:73-1359(-)